jgi:ubiquinone/menaquinone biosynthesis C-methylase UbiE
VANDNWYIWNHDKTYQDTMQKRASGELPEMESAKALCEVLKPYYKKGMTLADIGCGGGHYLRSLRTRLDPDISYTGVDATESYIRMAEEAFPGVPFQVGDVYELPFEDSSFDIVTRADRAEVRRRPRDHRHTQLRHQRNPLLTRRTWRNCA